MTEMTLPSDDDMHEDFMYFPQDDEHTCSEHIGWNGYCDICDRPVLPPLS